MATLPANPSRPGLGKAGRPLQVKVNTFPVTKLPEDDLYHYDMSIEPEVPTKLNRQIFAVMEEQFRNSSFKGVSLAFDGRKNIYCNKRLSQKQVVLDLEWQEGKRLRQFKITIKFAAVVSVATLHEYLKGKVNVMPQEVIQAFDVVARHRAAQKLVIVGSSLFSEEGARGISGGLDVWSGFYTSIRLGTNGLIANVDTSFTAFYRSGNVVDFLSEFTRIPLKDNRGPVRPGDIKFLERGIKGLRVEVVHSEHPRKYRVLGLTETGANETFFENEEGKKMSVVDYFKDRYKWNFKYPNLPCLRVGSPQRFISIPMECCNLLKGQKYPKKLNERQTADLIKIACVKTRERSEKINRGMQMITGGENSKTLQDFGVQIGSELMSVNARVLNPPKIFYDRSDVQPRDGVWNMQNRRFQNGCVIESFGFVNLGDRDVPPNQVDRFIKQMMDSARDYGVTIKATRPEVVNIRPSHNMTKEFEDAYDRISRSCQKDCQLIVCFLSPRNATQVYGEVKRITDSVLGIPSQCVQAKNVARCNAQLMANILLKINSKLGGCNSSLTGQLPFVSEKPTIVFGADVTHPGPGGGGSQKPSIAAVVASMDRNMARYSSVVEVQNSREEIIIRLKDIVKSLLKNFKELSGHIPARILFYRDGVSEGQFAQVKEIEIKAIRQACSELSPDYKPPLTFVIVKKRHHIRFFPMGQRDADRSGNVLPGTVVESGVTHPRDFDFFLCSHAGIQGTSRPAHYYCVLDENNFSSDSLQELTYNLCYSFVRCTRSVSVVPPAYYAHLAAFRARARSQYDDVSDTASVVSTGSNSGFSVPTVTEKLSKTMYFV